jgi:hypothetical protein
MKKFMVIGLVLAAVLVLGSCGAKGGTIEVTNTSTSSSVKVYILDKDPGVIMIPPTSNVVTSKTIGANSTENFTIDEDGTYYLRAFYILAGIETPNAMFEPITASAILLAGNTVSLKVKPIVQ